MTDQAVGYEDCDIALKSGRLRVRRWGAAAAPAVLCVPGLSANLCGFDRLAEPLAGDTLQLVAIDLRGHGRSEVTGAGTYGWCNHARDVLGIADAVGAPSFAVIGQTSGAAIAMTCAQLEPSRIAAQSPGQSGYPQRYVVRDAQVRIRVGMNWKSSMLALRSAICWTDSGVASCSASITIQA